MKPERHIERLFKGGPLKGERATFPESCGWVPHPPMAPKITGSYVLRDGVFYWTRRREPPDKQEWHDNNV